MGLLPTTNSIVAPMWLKEVKSVNAIIRFFYLPKPQKRWFKIIADKARGE
jgi:hypothetical protein